MKRKFIPLALVLTMCLILCSCDDKSNASAIPAVAVDDGTEADEYVYTGNGTSAWRSSLFESPSTEYNDELVLVAAEMSAAAENDNGDDKAIREKFSEYSLYACEYYNFDGTSIFAGGGAFAIGQDTLTINNVNTTLLVIVARGTINAQEGIGDYFKGGEVDFLNTEVWRNAYDFEEKIWDGLMDYIEKFPVIRSKENLKILITGHSLGGAAANMIGARFTNGIGGDEWWSGHVTKDDVYVYTFGAIEVFSTDKNLSDGYENIHNIYNHYDSFGPYGNLGALRVSSINAKFGHSDEYSHDHTKDPSNSGGLTLNHNMSSYIDDLTNGLIHSAPCEKCKNTNSCLRSLETAESGPPSISISQFENYSIEGTWKNVGSTTFGQAQAGSIIIFDGTHCNYFSPYDTYAFYAENGQWVLDCTSYIFADTLNFLVDTIDENTINIYYGSDAVQLKRVSQDVDMIQDPNQPSENVESDFAIEGSWLSVGSEGFGQAQPGMTVTFDGTHCNFYSPYDTYAFYQENGQWKLDCTSFLFSETLTFTVEIVDSDTINIYSGTICTELERMN